MGNTNIFPLTFSSSSVRLLQVFPSSLTHRFPNCKIENDIKILCIIPNTIYITSPGLFLHYSNSLWPQLKTRITVIMPHNNFISSLCLFFLSKSTFQFIKMSFYIDSYDANIPYITNKLNFNFQKLYSVVNR